MDEALYVCAVNHGAVSGLFISMGAFAIVVKINARVGRFDKRLDDDMFVAVIDVDIYRKLILLLNPISVVNFNTEFGS